VLRDDSTRLAERARAAGVLVDLKIWPVVPHAWQLVPHLVPEARHPPRKRRVSPRSGGPRGIGQGSDNSRMTQPAFPSTNSSVTNVDVLIVGAVFRLCMGIKLLEAGMNSFLIIEKERGHRRTWWENRLPRLRLRYSFAPFTRSPSHLPRNGPVCIRASRKSTTTSSDV